MKRSNRFQNSHVPSRGTNGTPHSQSREKSPCSQIAPGQTLHRPKETNRLDCVRAATGMGWIRESDDWASNELSDLKEIARYGFKIVTEDVDTAGTSSRHDSLECIASGAILDAFEGRFNDLTEANDILDVNVGLLDCQVRQRQNSAN